MKEKLLAAAVIAALTLTSCANSNTTVTETTTENTSAALSETQTSEDTTALSVASEEETTANMTTSAALMAFGLEITPDFYIDLSSVGEITDEATDDLNGVTLETLRIENCGDKDLSFISKCGNVKNIYLRNVTGSASEYVDILSALNPEIVRIYTENYSDSDADILINAFPDSLVQYSFIGDNDLAQSISDNALIYYNDVLVGGESWRFEDTELSLHFQNNTDADAKADTLKIFRSENNGWTPVPFSDGAEELRINVTAAAGALTDYTVSSTDFDCMAQKTGRYKTVVSFGEEEKEMEFFISAERDSFLSDEQQRAFDGAEKILSENFGCSSGVTDEYAASHTVDDFMNYLYESFTKETADKMFEDSRILFVDEATGELISNQGGRGSDICLSGFFLTPVYSDENTVIIKRNLVYNHGDYPNNVWSGAMNVVLVNTPDGWRVSKSEVYF